jgi:26 proteasome complex subunit DSS1
MSGSQNPSDAAKSTAGESKPPTPPKEQTPAAKLEEDDEFEDFPSEGMLSSLHSLCFHIYPLELLCDDGRILTYADWTEENTDLPSGNTHLWEESWDDDDTNDDFSAQLKEELKKVEGSSAKKA